MEKHGKRSFDFDELSRFARTDPSKFVETREALISEFLNELKPSKDLVELQNYIDAERYRVGIGMPSCCSHLASIQSGIEQLKLLMQQLEKQIQLATR